MARAGGQAIPRTAAEEIIAHRAPALLRAAETLGKNKSEAEKVRAAQLLDKMVMYEAAGRYPGAMLSACPSCLPYLADGIDARAVDLIKAYDDILVKLSITTDGAMALLDASGKPITSASDYNRALHELSFVFAPSMNQAKHANSPNNFSKRFLEKIKDVRDFEVEYDAKDGLLTVAFKSERLKAKVAKIDVGKMMSSGKYLLFGGGLASLGYSDWSKNEKSAKKEFCAPATAQQCLTWGLVNASQAGSASSSNEKQCLFWSQGAACTPDPKSPATKRYNLLAKLDGSDLSRLRTEADVQYLVSRVQKLDPNIPVK